MKSLYFLLVGCCLFFLSCSSSYKTSQTIDDVYYSPAVTVHSSTASNDNGYVTSGDDGDYVSVQGNDDVNSYGYRNDVQEDWAIRRGIWNPMYRNSFSLSLGMGGYYGNYYSPFYSPFMPSYGYGPFSYGYSSLWNPFYPSYGGIGFYNYYGNPYNNYFSPYGNYYGYYPGYSHGLYNGYYTSPYSRVVDNGPRISGVRAPRTGINTPIRGTNYPTIAPVRTLRSGNGNQIGTIERRTTPRNNNAVTPDNNRNTRKFRNAQRNNDYYTPSRSENRRSTPSRSRDVNPAPNRTFERNTPSVERTPSAPSAPRTSSPTSAPVRKF